MDAMLGSIQLVAFNLVPRGWAVCNGFVMNIMQNPALYSLLGTQYGGDGKTTFALPNLPGPAPGLRFIIATQGNFPQP